MAKNQKPVINEKSLLTRGLRVIDAISRAETGLRFSQIAEVLGSPSPATVNKILKELLAENVVQRLDDGAYGLAAKVQVWSAVAASSVDEPALIKRELHRLHTQLQVTAKVFVRVGDQIYCTDGFVDEASPALMSVGNHTEIHPTVIGAVFFMSKAELNKHDKAVEKYARIHDYAVTADKIRKVMKQSIQNGIEDDQALYYPGSRRLSVPVSIGGQVKYILGIGAMPVRFEDKTFLSICRNELFRSAQTIQTALA